MKAKSLLDKIKQWHRISSAKRSPFKWKENEGMKDLMEDAGLVASPISVRRHRITEFKPEYPGEAAVGFTEAVEQKGYNRFRGLPCDPSRHSGCMDTLKKLEEQINLDPTFYVDHPNFIVREYANKLVQGE